MAIGNGVKGYKQVCLTKDNKKSTKKIHRLVAMAFIPNPDNLPCVNHKDENKANNNVDNLEWCSFEYNTKYGTRAERCGKPINQYSLNGELLATFHTSKEAERQTGIYHSHILNCCHNKPHYNTAAGFKWKFGERGESLWIK